MYVYVAFTRVIFFLLKVITISHRTSNADCCTDEYKYDLSSYSFDRRRTLSFGAAILSRTAHRNGWQNPLLV